MKIIQILEQMANMTIHDENVNNVVSQDRNLQDAFDKDNNEAVKGLMSTQRVYPNETRVVNIE